MIKRTGILLISILCFYTLNAQNFLIGFDHELKGETLEYHAPQADANEALLARSESSDNYIEFETQIIPRGFNNKFAKFLLLAGIDVNPEDRHAWKVYIDNHEFFLIKTPTDTLHKRLIWNGPRGSRLEFNTQSVDKYGDLMGYLTIELHQSQFEKERPVRVKIVGENANSRTWFMIHKYATKDNVKITAQNAVLKKKEGNTQVIKTEIVYYGEPVETKIEIEGSTFKKTLNFGYNVIYLDIPQIKESKVISAKVYYPDGTIKEESVKVDPVENRTVYLVHTSHVDIGYTHRQKEVEEIQWGHLDLVLDLIEETKDYPEGSKFKWNTEVVWSFDSYLKKASKEQRDRLVSAISSGSLELHGLYANVMLALCSSVELAKMTEDAVKLNKELGGELKSAMITDIPGWTWGAVPVFAQSGIKYFSVGVNRGHRIGSILDELGDKPFYWVSASGREKVLCWVHKEGYSLFHTGLAYEQLNNLLNEEKLFPYLNWMQASDYPYDMTVLRYNIGSDNGPPHPQLPDLVKEWNEKYESPKLVISTVSEAFSEFETKYGNQLPEMKGDITAYWEDGAFSSAKETAINRNNASKLTQAERLYTLISPKSFPEDEFNTAWKNVILYDEHTWGSWNSISEPHSPFTTSQWEFKKDFSLNAANQSMALVNRVLSKRMKFDAKPKAFEVFNTDSWSKTDIVEIALPKINEAKVLNEIGLEVPSQLSNGKLTFLVKDIQSFSSKIFEIKYLKPLLTSPAVNLGNSISNKSFEVVICPNDGSIESIFWKSKNIELVKNGKLNQYIYVKGRNPENKFFAKDINIRVKEDGPVYTSFQILAEAEGCEGIETEIRLYHDIDRIDIKNTIDKTEVYSQEAVHFSFPFNIENPVFKYDLAFSIPEIEKDQIQGSNKNYITTEGFVDISNADYGLTWTCPDAPMIEVGEIRADPIIYGWIDSLKQTSEFYSYVMNNYWETNYLAAQKGKISFNYSIFPHQSEDISFAEKRGIESRQPLIAIPVAPNQKKMNSKIQIEDNDIHILSMIPLKKNEYKILLQNFSDEERKLSWINEPKRIKFVDLKGDEMEEVYYFSPFEIKTIIIRF